MSFPRDLSAASYSGISFLVNVTETSGGRKDVLHSFPNSDTQFIEDLGLRPRTYLVTAIINETARQTYINKRDSLLTVLEAGLPADLVHPFYGSISNVVARNFRLKETVTRLGDGEIDIEFTESTSVGTPQAVQNSSSVLGRSARNVSSSSVFSVTRDFIIRGINDGNFLDATDKLNDFVRIVRGSLTAFPVDTTKLDSFTRRVNRFSDSIPSVVFTPSQLASDLNGLITDLSGLYEEPNDQIRVMQEFAEFGINDIGINQTTASRIQRQLNRDVINNQINSETLSQSYVSTSQVVFSNIDEINEIEDILENQYQFIIA